MTEYEIQMLEKTNELITIQTDSFHMLSVIALLIAALLIYLLVHNMLKRR